MSSDASYAARLVWSFNWRLMVSKPALWIVREWATWTYRGAGSNRKRSEAIGKVEPLSSG